MDRTSKTIRLPDYQTTHRRMEQAMNDLSLRERELVALGAAMGSNCAPCIEIHIPEARKAGLSDAQIAEAIQLVDKVRQVPARKVLAVASGLLQSPLTGTPAGSTNCAETSARCCG
ncbi:MAG TPA: carboxymuconolactone decarboxylase family protein [Noviherbaspirillum sp.]